MPKCLDAELSGHFGTSAEVSSGHFGTRAEVSWYRCVLGPKCPVTTEMWHWRRLFESLTRGPRLFSAGIFLWLSTNFVSNGDGYVWVLKARTFGVFLCESRIYHKDLFI